MKHLRYLGLVTLLAVMTCNISGQTVRQKDRVISGNANLSKLNQEGTGAVKDDKLREVLLDSGVNAGQNCARRRNIRRLRILDSLRERARYES